MFSNLSEPQSCDLYISSLIIVKIKNPEAQTTGFSILYKNFLIQILIEYTIEKVAGTITNVKKVAKVNPKMTVQASGPQKITLSPPI